MLSRMSHNLSEALEHGTGPRGPYRGFSKCCCLREKATHNPIQTRRKVRIATSGVKNAGSFQHCHLGSVKVMNLFNGMGP